LNFLMKVLASAADFGLALPKRQCTARHRSNKLWSPDKSAAFSRLRSCLTTGREHVAVAAICDRRSTESANVVRRYKTDPLHGGNEGATLALNMGSTPWKPPA
jgi:hypothetical protein